MSFLNGNCCLKLNYLICGSKDFSSKKKKFNLRQKSIVNDVCSNTKVINKNSSCPITFYKQHNINVTSLEQQNSSQKSLKCNKDGQTIKSCGYGSSLSCSIDHQSSYLSHSTLNNEMIIKNIILHRNNLNERFGLTLCYGITSKSTINIYIDQIDKNSIADYQGKIQCGDQIIKINNHYVTNRDQAIHLINGTTTIILQIIPFQSNKTNFSTVGSTITEDDSGVILGCNTDFETYNQTIDQKCLNEYNCIRKSCNNLSCLLSNNCSNCRQNRLYFSQIEYRRCLSLNDLTSCSFINEQINYSKCSIKDIIHSQSLFEITTDNENAIVKPLPFNNCQNKSDSGLILPQYQLNSHSKQNRRRYREQYLKEKTKLLITTDDEIISELKQGRYWTKQQRKKQFRKSKQYQKRIKSFQQYSINSTTEDFNLLNRIFLRENQQELKEKPYLAVKYQQQSMIEKEKLKNIIQKYPLHHRLRSQSTTPMSINTTRHYPLTIII